MIMRSIRPKTAIYARAALGLALTAGLLVASLPARAGDDDVPIDTRILRNIMHGLGLKDGSEATINYEERPPLVIPPDKNLPPPQTGNVAVNNPAWPKDPDVQRAKRERQTHHGVSSEDIEAWSRPLSPSQLNPNASSAPHYHRQYGSPNNTAPDMDRLANQKLTPSELGVKGFGLVKMLFDNDKKGTQFTGEPPRVSLTEPPPGYQTPSPEQPYGGSKAAAPSAENYYTTHGEADTTK